MDVRQRITVLAVVEDGARRIEDLTCMISAEKSRSGRRRLQSALDQESTLNARREAMLPPRFREQVATYLVNAEWMRVWRDHSPRNPYCAEALPAFGLLGPQVLDRARRAAIEVVERRHGATTVTSRTVLVTQLPSVLTLLQPDFVVATLTAAVERMSTLVAAGELVHAFGDQDDALVVEHSTTGLRIQCHQRGDGLAIVCTDSPRIPAVRSLRDGTGFAGLGIGRTLYVRAAEIWPQVRWIHAGGGPTAVAALRRHLHQLDPYRWQDTGCERCAGSWRSRGAEAFTDHVAAATSSQG